MSKLNDLLDQRGQVADKIGDMRQHIDNWSDENHTDFNNLSNQYDDLTRKIEATEKIENVNKEQNEFSPTSKPEVNNTAGETKYGTEQYENDFQNWVQSKGKICNALEVGTDSEGGFIVAESWERELNKLLFDESIMRQVASVRNYGTDTNIPLTASVGAVGWIDEEGNYPTNSAAFANKKLIAHKAGNIELVSEELLADSFINLRSELGAMYAESFGAGEETAFTDGDGSGKPTGFLQDATKALDAASATAITYDEVVNLQSSVAEKYAKNGIYMCNRSTAAALRKLKDSGGMPLWAPAMTAGMPDTLFGKSLRINESMANMATTTKSIAFGDFSYYRIADRAGLMMQMLVELYAGTGQVGFKFMKRTDGLLLRADAIKYIAQA